MIRRGVLLLAKPVSQGYIAAFPEGRVAKSRHLHRRSMEANSDVAKLHTVTYEGYEEWFKQTYGVAQADECPSLGPSAGAHLSDAQNMTAAEEYDEKAAIEELNHWNKTFKCVAMRK